ncbi:ABC transporter substrate-binding protein [Nocardioides sp.]|uniref:ABC transporter substrate-binding protein n=1 Tax=Nocardioides sp. TaxID=35761 RepID=UPI0039E57BF5
MPTRPHHLRRGVLGPGIAAALMCATVLSACGSSDSSGSDAASESSSSSSSTGSDTLQKVTIQRGLNTGWQPVIWAVDNGYFEENGLDVTVNIASADTSKNIPNLVSGQIDITQTSIQPVTSARGQGLPVRIVSGAQNATANTTQDDSCLAPPDSSITELADLEGAKVAVPSLGHPLQIVNNVAMRNEGLDPSKVSYVALETASMIDAALNGTVDAICANASYYFTAIDQGFTALNKGTVGEIPDAAQIVWGATDDYAEEHADIIAKFQTAMEEAYSYLNEHPEDYRQVTLDNSDMTEEVVAQMAIPDMSTALSRTAAETIANEMKLSGFVDTVPSIDELIDSSVPDL